jgi:hypothetical protein
MKALEFEGRLENKNQIQVPPDLAQQIPEGSAVRVIVLFDSTDDESWRQLSLEHLSGAYGDEDAVYERLLDGSTPG